MDKRLVIYLSATFGLSWVVWAVAGVLTGATTQGLYSSAAMGAAVALSMFFPLVGALVTNAAMPPEKRIDLCVRPRLRGNGRLYMLAWSVPALLALAGGVVFFLVFPGLFDCGRPSGLRASLPARWGSSLWDSSRLRSR